MREELNKHTLLSTLVHTYTLAKQKPGPITQNETFKDIFRRCSRLFVPPALWFFSQLHECVGPSPPPFHWAASGPGPAPCKTKTGLFHGTPETFIHSSFIILHPLSLMAYETVDTLQPVTEEGSRLFPPIFSIRLSLSLRLSVQGLFFSLSLKAFTHTRGQFLNILH